MNKKNFLMLHYVSYEPNKKYKLVTFILNTSHILDIKEDLHSEGYFSLDIVDENENKVCKDIFGNHPCFITTDYVDDKTGNLKVFHALEDIHYIYNLVV